MKIPLLAAVLVLMFAANGVCSEAEDQKAAAEKAAEYKKRLEAENGPEVKSGIFLGVVTSAAENAVSVQDKAGKSETFVPHWLGGNPTEGGGPDQKVSAMIARLGVGDTVEITWEWKGAYRVTDTKIVAVSKVKPKPVSPTD
jgi:hypothetical protein